MSSLPHQPPALIKANGITLCHEIFGDPTAPPLVLIMGLGAQMIIWDDEFCQRLAASGFRVIRFDNRDIGQSQKMSGGGRVGIIELLALRLLRRKVRAPYLLRDMARDVTGLLDALEIPAAHLVGASMGGMIAQECAIHFPERVLSLTSIMSTTGDPSLPGPTKEAMAVLMQPPPKTRDEFVASFRRTWEVLRVGDFPLDALKDIARAERCFDRGLSPAGVARQFRAVLASGSRKATLSRVRAPALVIHGKLDPLIRVECGIATAHAIPGAKLLLIDIMGHALPVPVWDEVIAAIAAHAGAAQLPAQTSST